MKKYTINTDATLFAANVIDHVLYLEWTAGSTIRVLQIAGVSLRDIPDAAVKIQTRCVSLLVASASFYVDRLSILLRPDVDFRHFHIQYTL